MLETEYRRRYLAACSRALPDLRLFNRNVGFFKTPGGGGFRAGIKGQADIYGFFRLRRGPFIDGVQTRITIPIEVELKKFGQSLKPEQEAWRNWCQEWEVPYLLLEEKSKTAIPSDTIGEWVNQTREYLATL